MHTVIIAFLRPICRRRVIAFVLSTALVLTSTTARHATTSPPAIFQSENGDIVLAPAGGSVVVDNSDIIAPFYNTSIKRLQEELAMVVTEQKSILDTMKLLVNGALPKFSRHVCRPATDAQWKPSGSDSVWYHEFAAEECTNGLPQGDCDGFMIEARFCGQEQGWTVIVPGNVYDRIGSVANQNIRGPAVATRCSETNCNCNAIRQSPDGPVSHMHSALLVAFYCFS